jgi:hypothetical protein
MMNSKTFVDVCGETYHFESALISGTNEKDGLPVTLFSGRLDIDDIHKLLVYTHRTVVKMLVDHFDIPLENVDSVLYSAMSTALEKEFNIKMGLEVDSDQQRIIKYGKE